LRRLHNKNLSVMILDMPTGQWKRRNDFKVNSSCFLASIAFIEYRNVRKLLRKRAEPKREQKCNGVGEE
jgi:hypothetical protein